MFFSKFATKRLLMPYVQTYPTPLQFDDLIMESDGEVLTGLHFANDNYIPKSQNFIENNLPIFDETRRWLDDYFYGKQPDFLPKFRIENATNFRQKVLEILPTRFFTKISHRKRHKFSAKSFRNFAQNSLRKNRHIRRNRRKIFIKNVRPSRRRRSGLESNMYNNPLPQSNWRK